MRRPLATIAAALALSGALSGCVAAVIPIAAGGVISKRKLARQQARALPPAPVAAPVPTISSGLTLLPVGSTLPPPSGIRPTAAPPEAGWRALVRHVARAMSSGASCPDGTTAVLIDAAVAGSPAAERDAAVASLNALRTMGASVTFVADDPTTARAALTAAAMAEADTKVATSTEVTAIARSGCVVASGGGTRAAFNGLAWFALPSQPITVATLPAP